VFHVVFVRSGNASMHVARICCKLLRTQELENKTSNAEHTVNKATNAIRREEFLELSYEELGRYSLGTLKKLLANQMKHEEKKNSED
jgi:glucan phosphorylase